MSRQEIWTKAFTFLKKIYLKGLKRELERGGKTPPLPTPPLALAVILLASLVVSCKQGSSSSSSEQLQANRQVLRVLFRN